MINFITSNLLWSQAKTIWYMLIIQGIFALALYRSGNTMLAAIVLALLLIELPFTLYFFRNPTRTNKADKDTTLLCPADGKVVAYEHINHPDGYTQKVSIFLSPLDVHVQWTPIGGTVEHITYKPGKFVPAFLPKSSELNERMDMVLKNNQGRILVRQIAGTVARRIVVWLPEKAEVHQGQKYGMIKFGSRVDIFLPATVNVLVHPGQRVHGGLTELGKWSCSH